MAGRSLSDVLIFNSKSLTTDSANFKSTTSNVNDKNGHGLLIADPRHQSSSTNSVRQLHLQNVVPQHYLHQQQPVGYYSHGIPNNLPRTPVTSLVQQQQQQHHRKHQQQEEQPREPTLSDLLPHLSSYLNMIKNNVDDTPVVTNATVNHYPTPTSAIPVPISGQMDTDNDLFNWINSTPESEFPSPEFGHTPLQSFEDDGVEDTPLNDLVTPQLEDFDIFTDGNGKSSLDNLEGLFTMDESPEALMSYWDSVGFGSVSGTAVDSSAAVLPNMTLETEAIPLMGPPTNVSFSNLWEEPQKKKRKVQDEQVHQQKSHETMSPADMHVSISHPSQFVNKERDMRTMPPPNEVPVHLSSSNSGSSSNSPKPRVPLASTPLNKKTQTRKYTGTRSGITPAKLIPMDAPVQSRNYVLPSSTSRKELPAAFAEKVAHAQLASVNRGKKRGHSEVESQEVDDSYVVEMGGAILPSNEAATIQQAIEAKRLQNTHAARRSRARKLEYLKTLEDKVKDLEAENDELKNRVEKLETLIRSVGGGGPT